MDGGFSYVLSSKLVLLTSKILLLFLNFKTKPPCCFTGIISTSNRFNHKRHCERVQNLWINQIFFKNSFFPSSISEWYQLNFLIRNLYSTSIFKENILGLFFNCIILLESNYLHDCDWVWVIFVNITFMTHKTLSATMGVCYLNLVPIIFYTEQYWTHQQ